VVLGGSAADKNEPDSASTRPARAKNRATVMENTSYADAGGQSSQPAGRTLLRKASRVKVASGHPQPDGDGGSVGKRRRKTPRDYLGRLGSRGQGFSGQEEDGMIRPLAFVPGDLAV